MNWKEVKRRTDGRRRSGLVGSDADLVVGVYDPTNRRADAASTMTVKTKMHAARSMRPIRASDVPFALVCRSALLCEYACNCGHRGSARSALVASGAQRATVSAVLAEDDDLPRRKRTDPVGGSLPGSSSDARNHSLTLIDDFFLSFASFLSSFFSSVFWNLSTFAVAQSPAHELTLQI